MKRLSLRKDGRVLIGDVECAFSLVARMNGLLGRDGLGPGRALYIRPCTGIHTMFMRFDIDVVFLARDLTVTRIVRKVSAFRAVTGGRGARSVVELESGWFPWDELREGDRVEWGRVAITPCAAVGAR